MDLRFVPMDRQRAEIIGGWRYPPELDFYNGDADLNELTDGSYDAVYRGEELLGFFCLGISAQVSGYLYDERSIDIGLGMNPAMIHQGLGTRFVDACLREAELRHPGLFVRLSVAVFNERAAYIYHKLGFSVIDRFTAKSGVDFYVMQRGAPRMIPITKPLREGMEVYSGHERFVRTTTRTIKDDGYNLSHFSMGAHCGTHMDAPAHFIEGGETIEAAPEEILRGAALLRTARDGEPIEGVPYGLRILLLRSENYSGVTAEQAQDFVAKGVRLIGTDRLSVSLDGEDARIHRILLSNGVWILENLALQGVADGYYDFVCMPMILEGCEGAPARAALWARGRSR